MWTYFPGNGITLEFFDTHSLHLQKDYKHVFVFSLFNVTHLLIDTSVYVFDENYKMHLLQNLDKDTGNSVALVKVLYT